MTVVKVQAIGDELGIVLPQQVVDRLKLRVGEVLHAIFTQDGLRLVRLTSEEAEQLRVAREVMERRRGVLRALAQS